MRLTPVGREGARRQMSFSAVPQRNRADEHRRPSRATGLGCYLPSLNPKPDLIAPTIRSAPNKIDGSPSLTRG